MKKNVILLSVLIISSIHTIIASPKTPKTPEAPSAPRVVNTESVPTLNIIKGCVMSHDKELLAGALIEVNGKKVYTDFDGRFEVEATAGSKAEVTMISYIKSQVVLSANQSDQVTIILQQQ